MRSYRIHEFAELAGVTVKALRHYDRLGLLKPVRDASGYRRYTDQDWERLEQIAALKFLGFSLRRIGQMLEPGPAGETLLGTLRRQRRAMEERQEKAGRAIRAIRAAEESLEGTQAVDLGLLRTIIQEVNMEDEIELMRKYYGTEEAWQRRQKYYREGPSAEWQQLYQDVEAALDQDPGGDAAQRLADRWLALGVRGAMGDPDAQTDSGTAWMDREHWPPAMKRRMAHYKLEELMAFMHKAATSAAKKYFSREGWDKAVALRKAREARASEYWSARVELFKSIEGVLDAEPGGEPARMVAQRFRSAWDEATGEDPDVLAGFKNAWEDRRNWTETLRWQAEAFTMLPYERFLRCADFMDRVPTAAG